THVGRWPARAVHAAVREPGRPRVPRTPHRRARTVPRMNAKGPARSPSRPPIARTPALVLLAGLLFFVAGRCLVPMDETDLFYNLRLGEIILGTGKVPLINLLSFTNPDAPDPNLAWLFQ